MFSNSPSRGSSPILRHVVSKKISRTCSNEGLKPSRRAAVLPPGEDASAEAHVPTTSFFRDGRIVAGCLQTGTSELASGAGDGGLARGWLIDLIFGIGDG
jgi:hypothetical protein